MRLLLNPSLWGLWLPKGMKWSFSPFLQRRLWQMPGGASITLHSIDNSKERFAVQLLAMDLPRAFRAVLSSGELKWQVHYSWDPTKDECVLDMADLPPGTAIHKALSDGFGAFTQREYESNTQGESWEEYYHRVQRVLAEFDELVTIGSAFGNIDESTAIDAGFSDGISPVLAALWVAEEYADGCTDYVLQTEGKIVSIGSIDRSYGPRTRALRKLSDLSYWAMPSWRKAWYPEQLQAQQSRV